MPEGRMRLFDCEVRSRPFSMRPMACTAGSLKLLEIGRFVPGSRCNRFGGIASGFSQFDGIIRVARFPERYHLVKRFSELGGVAGGSGVVGRIPDRPDRGRYGLHPCFVFGGILCD